MILTFTIFNKSKEIFFQLFLNDNDILLKKKFIFTFFSYLQIILLWLFYCINFFLFSCLGGLIWGIFWLDQVWNFAKEVKQFITVLHQIITLFLFLLKIQPIRNRIPTIGLKCRYHRLKNANFFPNNCLVF